jgi:hypothetical protein
MRRFKFFQTILWLGLALGGAIALPAECATASPGSRIAMPNDVRLAADDSAFATRQGAEEFLAHALPTATAANPRYRSDRQGVTMAWITKSIKFGPSKTPNGRLASMSEEALEFHDGVRAATGAHDVEFAIEDVTISARTDSGTLTEKGEPGFAVIFNCNQGQCIRSVRDGVSSLEAMTDISIQDVATRDKILKAFLAVQQAGGG